MEIEGIGGLFWIEPLTGLLRQIIPNHFSPGLNSITKTTHLSASYPVDFTTQKGRKLPTGRRCPRGSLLRSRTKKCRVPNKRCSHPVIPNGVPRRATESGALINLAVWSATGRGDHGVCSIRVGERGVPVSRILALLRPTRKEILPWLEKATWQILTSKNMKAVIRRKPPAWSVAPKTPKSENCTIH